MKKNTTVNQSLSSNDLAACTTVAVDLVKRVFQVAGEDAQGHHRKTASCEPELSTAVFMSASSRVFKAFRSPLSASTKACARPR